MRESWGDRDPFLQVNVVSMIGPCNFSSFPISVCGSEMRELAFSRTCTQVLTIILVSQQNKPRDEGPDSAMNRRESQYWSGGGS